MPNVFISYRRKDTRLVADHIHTNLTNKCFNAFLDTSDIASGDPWSSVLRDRLLNSDVVLVLIGEKWNEGDRLNNQNDWVREEVRLALNSGIPIIPVMIDGADFPSPLPSDIEGIREKNKFSFNTEIFDNSTIRLIREINRITIFWLFLEFIIPTLVVASFLMLVQRVTNVTSIPSMQLYLPIGWGWYIGIFIAIGIIATGLLRLISICHYIQILFHKKFIRVVLSGFVVTATITFSLAFYLRCDTDGELTGILCQSSGVTLELANTQQKMEGQPKNICAKDRPDGLGLWLRFTQSNQIVSLEWTQSNLFDASDYTALSFDIRQSDTSKSGTITLSIDPSSDSYTTEFTPDNANWRPIEINLSKYVTNTSQISRIAFMYQPLNNSSFFELCIDNVKFK